MRAMMGALFAVACAAVVTDAGAGALDECMIRGDQAAVGKCLIDAENEAQALLNKAEGDAGRLARNIDTATGRPGAAAALARSMRAFSDYQKAQCDFVRAMFAGSAGADQGQLGCRVDLTRRRARELQNF